MEIGVVVAGHKRAGRTLAARKRGIAGLWLFAKEDGGEGTGGGGFADTSGAGKDQAMGETIFGIGLTEPVDGGVLGEDVGEGEHFSFVAFLSILMCHGCVSRVGYRMADMAVAHKTRV